MLFSKDFYNLTTTVLTSQTLGVVFTAVVTAVATIWVAIINSDKKNLVEKNKILLEEKNQLDFEFKKLQKIIEDFKRVNISIQLHDVQRLYEIFNTICEKTNIDRILLFSGRNGTDSFRMINCHLEHVNINGNPKTTLSIGAVDRFINLESDDEYKKMLNNVKINKSVYYKVDEMKDCMLKEIYTDEKIFDSTVKYATAESIDKDNIIMFYFSYATHNEQGHKHQASTLKLYHDQLASIVDKFFIHK